MNKIKFILLFVLSVIFLLPVGCKKTQEQPAEQKPSTNTTASIGMQAPQLSIAQWVKGKPVDIAAGKGKKIFVVEFWATWCPPCKVTIPHLTETQKSMQIRTLLLLV
jgi:thiol-disulfide isomerase/thioredoxin